MSGFFIGDPRSEDFHRLGETSGLETSGEEDLSIGGQIRLEINLDPSEVDELNEVFDRADYDEDLEETAGSLVDEDNLPRLAGQDRWSQMMDEEITAEDLTSGETRRTVSGTNDPFGLHSTEPWPQSPQNARDTLSGGGGELDPDLAGLSIHPGVGSVPRTRFYEQEYPPAPRLPYPPQDQEPISGTSGQAQAQQTTHEESLREMREALQQETMSSLLKPYQQGLYEHLAGLEYVPFSERHGHQDPEPKTTLMFEEFGFTESLTTKLALGSEKETADRLTYGSRVGLVPASKADYDGSWAGATAEITLIWRGAARDVPDFLLRKMQESSTRTREDMMEYLRRYFGPHREVEEEEVTVLGFVPKKMEVPEPRLSTDWVWMDEPSTGLDTRYRYNTLTDRFTPASWHSSL